MTKWLKPHHPNPLRSKRAPLQRKQQPITHAELLDILNDPNNKALILDVRDDDAQGGHIRGACHFPESLWQDSVVENGSVIGNYLLQVLFLIKDEKPNIIIIHCMESAVRGPYSVELLQAYCKNVPIVLLKGGADQFIRKYYQTPYVVDYDNDIWGLDQ